MSESKEKEVFLPTPLDKIVDVNKERRSIVYEVTLGRDLGFEFVKGFDRVAGSAPVECAVVGEVRSLNLIVGMK